MGPTILGLRCVTRVLVTAGKFAFPFLPFLFHFFHFFSHFKDVRNLDELLPVENSVVVVQALNLGLLSLLFRSSSF